MGAPPDELRRTSWRQAIGSSNIGEGITEGYITGDLNLLSFDYPGMLKRGFPEMFNEMFRVTVEAVSLRRVNGKDITGVYGKIAALMSDVSRNSIYFRVGSMLFTRTSGDKLTCYNSSSVVVPLTRNFVAVPSGWVLRIDVDLHIEIPKEKPKHLKVTLNFDQNNQSRKERPKDTGVEVEVTTTWPPPVIGQPFPPQLSSPVQIESARHGCKLVYTIGDEISFMEFIMSLRRILANHRSQAEDILDAHKFLNLYSTQEHPLLAKYDRQPKKWHQVTLQVKDPKEKMTLGTTLVMRCDDLYVHGFINQEGVLYKLLDNENEHSPVIPEDYHHSSKKVYWGISYSRLLDVEAREEEEKSGEVAEKLTAGKKLGKEFAENAVRVLSSYPHPVAGINLNPKVALAGLIVMVCESARFNPIRDAFEVGWISGTRFTKEMVKDYLWGWKRMSGELRRWRRDGYDQMQHPISELQAIYLVHHAKGNITAKKTSGAVSDDPADAPASRPREDSSPGNNPSNDTSSQHGHRNTAGDAQGHGANGSSGAGGPGQPPEGQQSRDVVDVTKGHGRPRVELLAIHANPEVFSKGTTIIVFDGKRGQIIYRHGGEDAEKQQVQQGGKMDLVLTGPYTGISAYGFFDIEIHIPGNSGGPIKWGWDCEKMEYANQVDNVAPSHYTICANDQNNHIEVAKVTYAVMSNAREAIVQVKLRLKDGQMPGGVSGEILARIDGFKDKSTLFKGTGQCPSRTDDPWFLLELARKVVAVPCGKTLHIEVDLKIEAGDDKEIEVKVPLRFDNGICSSKTDSGREVEVEVTWYPEVKMIPWHQPDVVYTIGDEVSFTRFIKDLCRCLAKHPDKEKIMGHKLLAKQRAEQPARWLNVRLQVVEGKKTSSTTLIMRDDDLYVHGFMDHQGVCYELLETKDDSVNMLPEDKYNPQPLFWGLKYRTILAVQHGWEATAKLVSEGLGMSFAIEAVRRLSSSIHPDDQVGMMSARLALAGLIAMVCESARFSPIRDALAAGWSNGTGFTMQLMDSYVQNHVKMSWAVQAWKSGDLHYWLQQHYRSQGTYLLLNTPIIPSEDHDYNPVPRLELLSISADLGVVGTKIILFDGKRGQIIYKHEEQGEQGMVDLVLNRPYTNISPYGCFAIKIDIPGAAPIKWERDCYPKYTIKFDKPVIQRIGGNVAAVTYMVMSDALEATVQQVKLRLNDGHSPCGISGEITTLIDGLEDECRSILFNQRAKGTAQCFSCTEDSMFLLQLARNVVAVPRGKVLHIKVGLEIETSNNHGIKHLNADLYIAHGILSQCHVVDGGEVEVNVTWYPNEIKERYSNSKDPTWSQHQHEVVYTIGDDERSYIRFIMAVRRTLTNHPYCEDILDRHNDPDLSSTRKHPVLIEREMCLHIKLRVLVEGKETSTTLAIQYDGLYVYGFMNQNGWPYSTNIRSEEHKYDAMDGDVENVVAWVDSVRLGKTSAADAVRVLSRFHGSNELRVDHAYPDPIWRALATLRVMVCDSTKINHVHDAIAHGWNNETGLTKPLTDYIKNWERISSALLQWKDEGYNTWKEDKVLQEIGIDTPEKALEIIHLCKDTE